MAGRGREAEISASVTAGDEGALGNHAIREPSRASDHGDRGSPGADVDRSCVKKYTERDRDRDRERDRDKRDRSRSREKSRSR